MLKQASNIISLEAKDIINAQKFKKGFDTKNRGKWIYKGALDYSLEALKIFELDDKAFWTEGKKQYTKAVVNVTFKYSIKGIRKRKSREEDPKATIDSAKGLVIKRYEQFEKMNTQDVRSKLYREGFKLRYISYSIIGKELLYCPIKAS